MVEEEKANEEDEEGTQFTDEISSEDDEDLDDLVEEEVTVQHAFGKKRMPLSHSDYDFNLDMNKKNK